MSLEWILYLVGVLGALTFVLGASFCCLLVALIVSAMIFFDCYESTATKVRRFWRWSVPLAVTLLVALVFLPSERTLAMIAGAHYGKEAVASETGQKVRKLLEQKLDELLAGAKK